MFSNAQRPTVLLLGHAEDLGLLLRILQAFRPHVRCESVDGRAGAWLPRLAEPALGGLVVATDALARNDLGALEAALTLRPGLDVLLACGDRGLVGCERLLARPGVRLLAAPWTLDALEALFAAEAPAAPPGRTAADEDALLYTGVVEGFRDPLASLSGYLQLLRNREGGIGEAGIVEAALSAAGDLERLLDALNLASAARAPKPGRILLREAAAVAARAAWSQDRQPHLSLDPALEVLADRRILDAALYTSGLYLARFGPQGQPALEASCEGTTVRLAWSLPTPDPVPGEPQPPPDFLPRVLDRLARRMNATPILERVGGVIPVRSGLAWEQSREE